MAQAAVLNSTLTGGPRRSPCAGATPGGPAISSQGAGIHSSPTTSTTSDQVKDQVSWPNRRLTRAASAARKPRKARATYHQGGRTAPLARAVAASTEAAPPAAVA